MNNSKILNGLVIIMLFLLSLFIMRSIYLSIDSVSGSIGYFKQEFYKENFQDISKIREEFKEYKEIKSSISFYGFTKIYKRGDAFNVHIIGIDENHNLFNSTNIQYGELLTKEYIENREKNIVISESMALSYFGSLNVIGLEMKIDKFKYEVTGIIKDSNIIKSSISGSKNEVFVPITLYNDFKNLTLYTKVDVYKSSEDIGQKNFENTILYGWNKIDFFLIGMTQSQYIYLLFIPLGFLMIIDIIKKIQISINFMSSKYHKEIALSYSMKSLKNTIKNSKFELLKIILYLIGIVIIFLYLKRTIFFNPNFVANKLYSIVEILKTFSAFILDMVNPKYFTYKYEVELLLLTINKWIFIISIILLILLTKIKLVANIKNIVKYIVLFILFFYLMKLVFVLFAINNLFYLKESIFLFFSIGFLIFFREKSLKQ